MRVQGCKKEGDHIDMKTCPKCGAQLEDNVKFCDKCGAPVGEQKTEQNAAPNQGSAPAQTVPPAVVPYNNAQTGGQPVADEYDHTAEFAPEDIAANKIASLCPYVFSVLGVIIALMMAKESPYVRFHVNQALKIWICMVLAVFLEIIPFLGFLATIIWMLISFVLIIIGFVNAGSGKAKEIPIVRGISFLN